MAIRFKKYKNKVGDEVKALRITEKNVEELVAYIVNNGGKARDESKTYHSDALKDGQYTAVKLALRQLVLHSASKRHYRAVRKAFGGDIIIRHEVENPTPDGPRYEFSRIKAKDFEEYGVVR